MIPRRLLGSVLLFGAVIGAFAPAPVRAEAWDVTEGGCFDWRGAWNVNQTGPNTWSGTINYRHTGGPCAGATGVLFNATVNVQINGAVWSAQRLGSSDGNDCTYGGSVQGTQLVGTYFCGRNAGPYNIVINRFVATTGGLEPGIDRPGLDYRSFDLPVPDPNQCSAACFADVQCRAFTFVVPGVQGPNARCWLKNAVPVATRNGCCTSGVVRP